ncbi:MAG: GNAT family N-acetyltransferase [Porticoccaceae bacterium]
MEYPFLRADFFHALEDSGSVTPETGWSPHHLRIIERGREQAFMPLYLKTHSWGEYVFDWSWADAYRRHGLDYYPKLLSAVPFTPATGPRIRFADGVDRAALTAALVSQAIDLAADRGASSWHILFPESSHLALLESPADTPGLMRRTGVQFHWFNAGYDGFDDFLGALASRKRKMIRRERRQVAEQGFAIEMLSGGAIGADLWEFFYRVYHRTYLKRSGGTGYLTREFFQQIGAAMPDQVAMAVARERGRPIAAALYFFDHDTLYGRYWGCEGEYDFLHFELCYYRGIDFAIERKLGRFDAGAQGEHKILRGFTPVETHSLHWIAHPGFAEAVRQFLRQEEVSISRYREEAKELLPYRKGNG